MAGNPNIEPRLLELIGKVPFWETIGIELDDAEVGRVRLRLAMREDLRTFGERRVLHGGAIATLIDSAAASATRTLRGEDEPPWRGLATTDMHVSYLAAVTGGEVTAEGRVLRAGRSVAFLDVEVRNEDGDLVARGSATMQIRRAD